MSYDFFIDKNVKLTIKRGGGEFIARYSCVLDGEEEFMES